MRYQSLGAVLGDRKRGSCATPHLCAKFLNGTFREPPIHFAADYCAFEGLETLLEHGADLHIPSTSGATPFYRACRGGNLDIVKRLKGCGCDINVRTWDSWTPMIEAVVNDHESIVDILIEWDADVSTVTEDGETALSIAETLGQLTIVGKFKCAISGSQETMPNVLREKYRE